MTDERKETRGDRSSTDTPRGVGSGGVYMAAAFADVSCRHIFDQVARTNLAKCVRCGKVIYRSVSAF